jgi:hypothetical protein
VKLVLFRSMGLTTWRVLRRDGSSPTCDTLQLPALGDHTVDIYAYGQDKFIQKL